MLKASLFIFALMVLYVLYRLFESFSNVTKTIESQTSEDDHSKYQKNDDVASDTPSSEVKLQGIGKTSSDVEDHDLYEPIESQQATIEPVDLDDINTNSFAQTNKQTVGITDIELANTGIPDPSLLNTGTPDLDSNNDTVADEVTVLDSSGHGEPANNSNYESEPVNVDASTVKSEHALGATAGIQMAANLIDTNDEEMDIGDMTMDVSEMLKELNLRESDSPRLNIDKHEYNQLKSGEPGEIKPEKIENVAERLRTMLH